MERLLLDIDYLAFSYAFGIFDLMKDDKAFLKPFFGGFIVVDYVKCCNFYYGIVYFARTMKIRVFYTFARPLFFKDEKRRKGCCA